MAREKKPVHKIQMAERKTTEARYTAGRASCTRDGCRNKQKSGAVSSHLLKRVLLTCAPDSVKSITKG